MKNYFEGRNSDILERTLPRKTSQRAGVSGPVPAEHVSTVGICTFIMSVFSGWIILVDFFFNTLMPKSYFGTHDVRQQK